MGGCAHGSAAWNSNRNNVRIPSITWQVVPGLRAERWCTVVSGNYSGGCGVEAAGPTRTGVGGHYSSFTVDGRTVGPVLIHGPHLQDVFAGQHLQPIPARAGSNVPSLAGWF
ncbi:hypothetical protein GCM10010277_86640 [Streptomyces longisporoflavus]|nr:hypothetical protein GCM10010277_86640 [Streptomyces longisporoflavus]